MNFSQISIKETLNIASVDLSKSVQNPHKEAKLLLSHILGKDEIFLVLNGDLKIDASEYFNLIARRVNHEPLEYITNKVSFYSRYFFIEEGVLIPRPETEILVDKAVYLIKQTNAKKIAEIGVGSGVISVMIALLCEDIEITATDISAKAIEVAIKNAIKFDVINRINFVQTSYLNRVSIPDIIISNPPYIAKNTELEKHVLNEPHEALFGGDSGDEMLKDIAKIYNDNEEILATVCEMGYDQKNSMECFFVENKINNFCFYKDLSGLDRGFILQRIKN